MGKVFVGTCIFPQLTVVASIDRICGDLFSFFLLKRHKNTKHCPFGVKYQHNTTSCVLLKIFSIN